MIYQIDGIPNKIEWDGITPPKIIRRCGKGYRKSITYPGTKRPFYEFFIEKGKRIRVSQGRIIFMLRTGISLKQCQEYKISVTEDGRLREETKRKRQWSLFKTLCDVKETIRILEDLSEGDSTSFYALMQKEKSFIRYVSIRQYGIKSKCFDSIYDDALEMTETQLRNFNFREIKKIHKYVINNIYELSHKCFVSK